MNKNKSCPVLCIVIACILFVFGMVFVITGCDKKMGCIDYKYYKQGQILNATIYIDDSQKNTKYKINEIIEYVTNKTCVLTLPTYYSNYNDANNKLQMIKTDSDLIQDVFVSKITNTECYFPTILENNFIIGFVLLMIIVCPVGCFILFCFLTCIFSIFSQLLYIYDFIISQFDSPEKNILPI
jgi:hypothetical protein